VTTTDARLRIGGTVRRAFGHAFISAAINAFFRSECLFLLNNFGSYFVLLLRRSGAVQPTESIKADAQAICAQSVVRALVRAQLDLASVSGKTISALALASGFMADTVLVAIVGASALVACDATPGLRARLARLAVAGAS